MAQVADWRSNTSRHQNHKRSTCTEEENKAYHRLWACFLPRQAQAPLMWAVRSNTAFGHGKLHGFGHSLSFDPGHSIIWESTQNFGIQRSEALFHILPASDPLTTHLFAKQDFKQPSSQSRNVRMRIGSNFFTIGTCWWSSFVFEILRQRIQNLLFQGFEFCLPLFFFTLFFLCLFPGFRRSLGIFTKFAKLLEPSATVTGRVTGHRRRPSMFASLPVWAVLITSTIRDKASDMGTLPGVKPPLLPPFPWRCQDCPKPFQERFLCQEDPFPSFSITPSCKGAGRLQNQQPAKQRKHGQPQCQGALPSCTIERCPAALPS